MKQVLNLFLFLLLVTFVHTSYAQDKKQSADRSPESMARKNADRMKQELNLTDDQTTKVYEINLRHQKERQAERAKAEKERSEKMADAKSKMDQRNAELKKVLTDEQYNKMIQHQQEKKDKMKKSMKDKRDKKGQRPVRPAESPNVKPGQ